MKKVTLYIDDEGYVFYTFSNVQNLCYNTKRERFNKNRLQQRLLTNYDNETIKKDCIYNLSLLGLKFVGNFEVETNKDILALIKKYDNPIF